MGAWLGLLAPVAVMVGSCGLQCLEKALIDGLSSGQNLRRRSRDDRPKTSSAPTVPHHQKPKVLSARNLEPTCQGRTMRIVDGRSCSERSRTYI